MRNQQSNRAGQAKTVACAPELRKIAEAIVEFGGPVL
jgi:hypothetical protein